MNEANEYPFKKEPTSPYLTSAPAPRLLYSKKFVPNCLAFALKPEYEYFCNSDKPRIST